MTSLAPFVERRRRVRLRETPLRRRNHVGPAGLPRDRRRGYSKGFDVAETLEINLDRYPTKPAMLTFLQSLLYAAEDNQPAEWRSDYVGALKKASDVLQDAVTPNEAVATLRGYPLDRVLPCYGLRALSRSAPISVLILNHCELRPRGV